VRKTVNLLSILWVIFALVAGKIAASGVQIKRDLLDGGGAMWLTTVSHKLSSSLGQSFTGVQSGATQKLYSRFWNPWVVTMSPVEKEEDFASLPSDSFYLILNSRKVRNPVLFALFICQVRRAPELGG
jgi:hypothetical protein